ncbi:MAG: hypothetical protein JOZ60_05350 [Verrucomicrobia bacterium]|nr:hypothetical protein [Verrucomicrobiota bacterium]
MSDFHIYAGISGDTDPGRFWSGGLYRSRNGDGSWASLSEKMDPIPHVFAILTDPGRPGRVTIGTENGICRSDDGGESWRRLSAPKPELAVWSLVRHPRDPNTIFAGYEPCAIYRSTDDGSTWQRLPVNANFPAISDHPDIPKRIISIAIDPSHPDEIYASLEVGGLLRSLDGGQNWTNVIDGLYIDEGCVDIHSVVVNPKHPGELTVATRFGTFRSVDRGLHWRDLKAPRLRPIGSYCRVLAYAPADADTLYLAAGNDFDGDRGALFISRDNGSTWDQADLGIPLKTTIFSLAVNPNAPDHVFCSSKIGQVLHSPDRGKHWQVNPLPHAVGHVFALSAG